MNKENLKAVVFASLKELGFDVKPYCIRANAYNALYLPEHETIIPVDLVDDKERRSPNNPVVQNNTASKDTLKVLRIRSMDCTPIGMTSFNYYLDDLEDKTILSLANYLGAEFKANKSLTELPAECDAIKIFKSSLIEYDNYFKELCCAYAEETGHTSLRKKESFHNEPIGVWLDFKGVGYEIKHKNITIRSRKTSFGSAMDEAHAKGQQRANSKLDKQWMDKYYSLKKYCDENNGVNTISLSNKEFGGWLRRQRSARRNGKLDSKYEGLLNDLGIDWEPTASLEQAWNDKFNMLLDYKEKYGTLDVPQSQGSFGTWVAKQRQLKRKGKLPPEREQKLSSIGFIWKSPNARHD